jgi:prolipoprotein diacylglyceryltransferase
MNIINSIPSPSVSYIDLGPLRVHFYALFILVGIALAIWIGSIRFKARGGKSGLILDIALWAVPFGIIGGRIFHVLTHWSFYFGPGKDLSKILAIWEGGLAIYGALILGVVGAYIGSRVAGVRFLSLLRRELSWPRPSVDWATTSIRNFLDYQPIYPGGSRSRLGMRLFP